MSNKKTTRNSLILVLTAFIWGVAFVAQREGGGETGPYTFIFLRYIIGGTVLLPVIKLLDKAGVSKETVPQTKEDKKLLIKGGICCGCCLGVASIFQQVGMYMGTPAGKAGFLTACYIVLVPILGLFLKKKCGLNVWLAVGITVIGLYLLCMNGSLKMQTGDILVLCCSLVFAMHILTIDNFINKNVNGVRMSCIQFYTASLFGLFPMFFIELHGSFSEVPAMLATAFTGKALISLLYAGVMSSGVAYTLQIIGQKDVNPTVASLIMSLESVFSVLAGWAILHESLSLKELFGCALIFAAITLAQLPQKNKAVS